MTPTEKHRETARQVTQAICGMSPCYPEQFEMRDIIAAALANSEREGMKRAAEIGRGSSGEYDFQAALAEGRDFDYGFHNGKNHAADTILAEIILSQAGEA